MEGKLESFREEKAKEIVELRVEVGNLTRENVGNESGEREGAQAEAGGEELGSQEDELTETVERINRVQHLLGQIINSLSSGPYNETLQ